VDGVGKLAGAKIQASFKLDTSILGGTVVRIGSTVYDGSVRGRLERLKEALMPAEVRNREQFRSGFRTT
jgi:F-type H+-transporting ATPase subunit delta